jgi:hypothetical protein
MTGTFSPAAALSAFNDKPANGVWSLSVQDWAADDTGTVNSWSVTVCTATATLSTPDVGLTDFAVYPNPNDGDFNIQFTSTSTNGVSVMVHDMRGRAIFENTFANSATFNQNVKLDNAQTGIYLLTVSDGDRKEVKKIVIK